MLTKILAASVLSLGLATGAAFAQSSGDAGGKDPAATVEPNAANPSVTNDPAGTSADPTTNSTTGVAPSVTGADPSKNCPDTPQGAMGDATNPEVAQGATAPTVNDSNCGK